MLNSLNSRLSKLDLGKIVILTIVVVLISNLQTPVFALTQGPPEVTIQSLGGEQTVAQILPEISGYTTRFIYRDTQFEEISRQDASLTYAYFPASATETTIWVTIEIAKTRSSLHSWEACLISWPQSRQEPYVTQLSLRYSQLLLDPPIIASFFAFQDSETNLTQTILYWYENAFFNTGSNVEQRHVKISLIAFPDTAEEVPNVEEQLLPLGKAIASYWQPIKTGAQITLVISQNAPTLTAILVALLIMVLTFQALRNREEKQSNLTIYNRLASEDEKLLLQAAHKASQKHKPTGNAIASYYQELTGNPIELGLLFNKLNEAEEAGLIRREIANKEDEPVLTWKTQMAFPKSSTMRGFVEKLIRSPPRQNEKARGSTKSMDK